MLDHIEVSIKLHLKVPNTFFISWRNYYFMPELSGNS